MIHFPAHDSFVCRSSAVKQPLMATCAMNPWTPKTSQTWRSWQSRRKNQRKWQNQNSWSPRPCQCCDDVMIIPCLYYIVIFLRISKIEGMGWYVARMFQDYTNCRMISRVEHFWKDCYAAGSITLHHIFAWWARLVKTYQSQSRKAAMKKGRNF